MDNSDKKNILYVFFTKQCSGAEISSINYIKKLDKEKFSPIAAVPAQGKVCSLLEKEKIPFIIEPTALFSFRNPFPFFKAVWSFKKIMEKQKIDIVHVNSLYPHQYVSLAAKLCKIPCVVHLQNIHTPAEFRRYFISLAEKVIVVSKPIASPVNLYINNPKRIFFLYHAVDCIKFYLDDETNNKEKDDKEEYHNRENLRKQYEIPLKHLCVALIGLIEERKGQHLYLEAAKKILEKNKKVHFFIIGDSFFTNGDYKKSLKEFVAKHQMGKNVHFTGFQEDIPSLLKDIDIVVFPYSNEPLGLAAIEASAAGKAIVGFASSGLLEVIENNKTGILVPEKDIARMKEAIEQYLNDPSLRIKHGNAAREKARKQFNIDINIQQLMEMYKEVLKESRS